jgi:hypothetical protein
VQTDFPLPSNRSFGRLFIIVFAVLAALSWWRGNGAWIWLAAVSALFAVVTWLRPDWLLPLNRAWMALAALLNRIVSPIVLGILFYGVVTPMGAVMRLMGKDPMRRKFDRDAASYWIDRRPPGPPPESLRDQF